MEYDSHESIQPLCLIVNTKDVRALHVSSLLQGIHLPECMYNNVHNRTANNDKFSGKMAIKIKIDN